jgi:hypothetical protein
MSDITEAAKAQARAAITPHIGSITTVVRKTFKASDAMRAEAEPFIALTSGITKELEFLTNTAAQLSSLITQLAQWQDLPEVNELRFALSAITPILAIQVLTSTTKLVSSALAIPNLPLSAITAAGGIVILEQAQANAESALLRLSAFINEV